MIVLLFVLNLLNDNDRMNEQNETIFYRILINKRIILRRFGKIFSLLFLCLYSWNDW